MVETEPLNTEITDYLLDMDLDFPLHSDRTIDLANDRYVNRFNYEETAALSWLNLEDQFMEDFVENNVQFNGVCREDSEIGMLVTTRGMSSGNVGEMWGREWYMHYTVRARCR